MEDRIILTGMIGILLLIFLFLVRWLLRKDRFPYEARVLLTDNERVLYELLRPIAEEYELVLLIKMRLADIMQVKKETKEYMKAFNRIKAKHTDFLLCDPQTLEVLVGIELDDESHKRADRIERDAFVDGAYEACGIPLLHVWNPITKEELQQLIEDVI